MPKVAGYYHFKGNSGATKAWDVLIGAIVLEGGRNRLKEFLSFEKPLKSPHSNRIFVVVKGIFVNF